MLPVFGSYALQLIFPNLSKRNTMTYHLTVSRACCNVEKTSRIFPRREDRKGVIS